MTEEEYLQHVKLDLFNDRIFVMTPKNDVINLPKGATALDFAFKIHEEVGLHAAMAKVNGEIVKLNQELPISHNYKIYTKMITYNILLHISFCQWKNIIKENYSTVSNYKDLFTNDKLIFRYIKTYFKSLTTGISSSFSCLQRPPRQGK